MNEFDTLLAFLGVAVTLAGFTGVVTLIDRSAARVSQEVVAFRVRNLVIGVIIEMILTVLPILLVAFRVEPSAVWRIACAFFVVAGGAYLVVVAKDRQRLVGAAAEGLNASQYKVMVALGGVMVMVALAAALGLVPASGVYLLGAFYFILAITSFFFRLVLMLEKSASRAIPLADSNDP